MWKNLGSLNASATSFLQSFEASGIRDIVFIMSSKLPVIFRGNVLHRKVGVSTCVDIVVIAAVIRSVSNRIFEMLGKIEAMMETTSSGSLDLGVSETSVVWWTDFSPFEDKGRSWENASGLIVKVAASRRTKRSRAVVSNAP